MKNIILSLFLVATLVGCIGVGASPDSKSITNLREYSISFNEKGTTPDFIVVGIGKWVKSGDGPVFKISSYDGSDWEITPPTKIEESAVSLDSFKRIKKLEKEQKSSYE